MSRPEHSRRPSRRRAVAASDHRLRTSAALAAGVILAAGVLAGCAPAGPGESSPSSTGTPSPTASQSPTSSPTPTETTPTLDPAGTAEDNLDYFAAIVDSVWAGPDKVSGRAYIDALVAGGFDKGAMQVTNDLSTVGNPAESIQFSVLWAGECLVGQVGPATGEPVAVVLPVVGDGSCLIGSTRPIDW
ncbi:hypothetical protein ABZ477_02940 [Microbacterium sp. NPDC019599]|uniref:DUF6993 domain-containing protein n=1 Tax=Microbacterium sp. NPDC019599 TaxID=3154690 RepID=UPI0033DE77B6